MALGVLRGEPVLVWYPGAPPVLLHRSWTDGFRVGLGIDPDPGWRESLYDWNGTVIRVDHAQVIDAVRADWV